MRAGNATKRKESAKNGDFTKKGGIPLLKKHQQKTSTKKHHKKIKEKKIKISSYKKTIKIDFRFLTSN
jgi:hypothetical protein